MTTLIFSKLGGMYGRKKIFQFSIVVFLAGSVLGGLAGNMTLLVLFHALQGIGEGGLNSLVMAVTGDLTPALQRSKYQALVGIVATLALIAGPLLGGLFSDQLPWRWIFYINIRIGVVALAAVSALLHLPPPLTGAGAVRASAAAVRSRTQYQGSGMPGATSARRVDRCFADGW